MFLGRDGRIVTAMTDTIDQQATDTTAPAQHTFDDPFAFAGAFLSWMNGSTIVLGLDAGHRAGTFEALAAAGPSTVEELAASGGFSSRHLREWLDLMTVGRVVIHDAATQRYRLAAGAAACLTGTSSLNMAPVAAAIAFSAKHVDAVATTLRHGGGIPYDAYRPEFTDLMDQMNRRHYDELLITGYIDVVPGLAERLRSGARVLDVGCGTGHVLNLLAREYPASTFTGYDLAEDAVVAARREAAHLALTNVRYDTVDVADIGEPAGYDVVLAFDAIHDQAQPRQVLAQIRQALDDDGLFLMVDVKASSHVHENLDQPNAPWIYGASLFHCMQVSSADGGEGLGTAWGLQKAHELLAEAGFTVEDLVDTPPTEMMNVIYVCRPSVRETRSA